MHIVLKRCLGIDVSKLSLSLSLGYLTNDLSKKFESHIDVSNDLSGYNILLKWLGKSLDTRVNFIIVMERKRVIISNLYFMILSFVLAAPFIANY
ncbi:MAG: transposase [Mariniflexile sp.]|jgi:transposase